MKNSLSIVLLAIFFTCFGAFCTLISVGGAFILRDKLPAQVMSFQVETLNPQPKVGNPTRFESYYYDIPEQAPKVTPEEDEGHYEYGKQYYKY